MKRPSPSNEAENPRVLFVDDDDAQRALFAEVASQLGFFVDLAATPSQALMLCADRAYPVIVTDLHLPERDGTELVRTLVELQNTGVFVLITGDPDLNLPNDKVLDRAIHSIVYKPWTLDELSNALRSALELSRSKQRLAAGDKRTLSVLLIEDDAGDACLAESYLKESNFEVTLATRLSEAMQHLQRTSFDVVLTDLSLPDARGLHAIYRIREHAPEVPIVVLTGLETEGLMPQAFLQGGQDFLHKSDVDAVKLAKSLHRAIDQQRTEKHFPRPSKRDRLTGLANRAGFKADIQHQIANAKRENSRFAVLVSDIARFRDANATLGQDGGDVLLTGVATRITAALAAPERAARLGKDEFGVVSELLDHRAEAVQFLERAVLSPLTAPFHLSDCTLSITTNSGIAIYPDDGDTAELLLTNVEAASAAAQQQRQQYVFYEAAMNSGASKILVLENQLKEALRERQFVLHYQPKVELATGAITGVEALLRWEQPGRGLVPPGEFIPVLEKTGLILDVGEWVLEHAAQQFIAWRESGMNAPRIAVNLSALQVAEAGFVHRVKRLLDKYPGAEAGLELEITESLVMENLQGCIKTLEALKDLGLAIAIDDFGTGYSSLGYLSRLPLDAVKIDRSFIRRFADDPRDMTIVTTMLTLAHSLELKIIAEGVETPRQAQLLRLLKCDEVQGFLISKPVPAEVIVSLVETHYEFDALSSTG